MGGEKVQKNNLYLRDNEFDFVAPVGITKSSGH